MFANDPLLAAFQDEGDEHIYLVVDYPAFVKIDSLLFYPGALHVTKSLSSAADSLLNCVFKAVRRSSADLGDASDGHGNAPLLDALLLVRKETKFEGNVFYNNFILLAGRESRWASNLVGLAIALAPPRGKHQ